MANKPTYIVKVNNCLGTRTARNGFVCAASARVRGFSRAHRAERLGQWLAIRSAKTSSDTANTASVVGKSTNATCEYNVPTPPR